MHRDLARELGLDEAIAIEASVVTVRTETRRYGKHMTILEGFDPSVDIDELAKALKNKLGAGGTVRDGHIELQGDHKKGARAFVESRGYRVE